MINLTPNYQRALPRHWIYDLPGCPISGHTFDHSDVTRRLQNPIVYYHVIYEYDALLALLKRLYIEKKPLTEIMHAARKLPIDSRDDDRLEWFFWGVDQITQWGLAAAISNLIPGGPIIQKLASQALSRGFFKYLGYVNGGAPSTKVREQSADWRIKDWLKNNSEVYNPEKHTPICATIAATFKHTALPQKLAQADESAQLGFVDAPADYYTAVIQRAWRKSRGLTTPEKQTFAKPFEFTAETTHQVVLENQHVVNLQFSQDGNQLVIIGCNASVLSIYRYQYLTGQSSKLDDTKKSAFVGYNLQKRFLLKRSQEVLGPIYATNKSKSIATIDAKMLRPESVVSHDNNYLCLYDRAGKPTIMIMQIMGDESYCSFKRVNKWTHSKYILDIKFHPQKNILLILSVDHKGTAKAFVEIYNVENHQIIATVDLTECHPHLTKNCLQERSLQNLAVNFVPFQQDTISVFFNGKLTFCHFRHNYWYPPILLPADLQLQNVYPLTSYHFIAFVRGTVYYIDCRLGDIVPIFLPSGDDVITADSVLTVDPVNKVIAIGCNNQVKVTKFTFQQ